MIPLHDDVPSRTTPYVNYGVIAVCALFFFAQQSMGPTGLIHELGMIPRRLTSDDPILVPIGYGYATRIGPAIIPEWLTPLSCTFLHGGWMHFLGNMWFLHIFGDNVEDRLGHVRYAAFYLVAGVFASLVHLVTNLDSTLPTVGASGAIAGVMGAYMLLYPRAQVLALLPVFVLMTFTVPAPVFLGIWFVMQFFQGIASIGAVESGGVAWWAHIGGFVIGFAVAGYLNYRQSVQPAVEERRPPPPRVRRIDPWRPPRNRF